MGFKSFFSIIGKDLKIFARSKVSAIIIILMPFLIILLAGFVFNSSGLSGVVIGVYSPSSSDLTTEILQSFEEQNFIINNFDSSEDCSNSVKLSKAQICIVFPEDLSSEGSSEDIVFYVDHSRLNLAYALIQNMEEKISAKSSDLGVALTQSLINSLDKVKNSLPNQKAGVSNSIESLEEINSNLEDISLTSEIEEALDNLEEVQDLAGEDEALRGKISNAISSLESLQNLNISSKVGGVKEDNKEILTTLREVSGDLNSLISALNSMEILEAERIVSPITTKIESVTVDSKNRDYLLPTLLTLIALFGGILLSATFVSKEKKTKAYFRNFMTPTKDFTFILASCITCLIILAVQFLFIFLGLIFILKISFAGMFLDIILVLLSSFLVFTFIGMFIGYIFRSEETIVFASVLIAAILMFFSNTILPIETISAMFKDFAIFNPVVVLDMALKKIILFGYSYSSLLEEFYILGGFFVSFVVLSYIGRKINKKRL
jgi:ABC-type multidrug transport system permease subunit